MFLGHIVRVGVSSCQLGVVGANDASHSTLRPNSFLSHRVGRTGAIPPLCLRTLIKWRRPMERRQESHPVIRSRQMQTVKTALLYDSTAEEPAGYNQVE